LLFESESRLTRIEANALYGCSSLKAICLPASVEFIGECSFSECTLLSSFTFDSGSKLTQIEAAPFSRCSFHSILISRSIKELGKDWALHSSLQWVTFESALSLRVMMETDKVDLSGGFEIRFVDCDCPLEFPGFSVETIDDTNDLMAISYPG
jgi:hypothetical protein